MRRKIDVDWKEIQQYHNGGMTIKEVVEKFSISRTCINTAVKKGLFVKIRHPAIVSDEVRKVISMKRKEWLRKNPEKHPWRREDKFKSVPCKKFKDKLTSMGISFLPEYIPLADRFFSIDVAFPDKRVGVEINGQQHYEADGSLKKYYQERHDLLALHGWIVIELHYSIVYDDELLSAIIGNIISSHDLGQLDYSSYAVNRVKKEVKCNGCGTNISYGTVHCLCKKCYGKTHEKVAHPNDDILREEYRQMSIEAMGRKYKVSGNSVRKWLKKASII